MEALNLSGIVKSYGSVKALDDVDLTVAAGEFVALHGPNGAGKTTLFQILSGLFVADRGEVHVGGRDMRRHPAAALAKLGIVFQQPTLDLELSVRRNLYFFARLHGLSRRDANARIDAQLARFDLRERADAAASTLSGGNRRRVELARALLHEPAFLLMDEATVGLDPASRREILEHVMELRTRKGVGVLWSTHLVNEATQADRVVVLHKGRVLYNGVPMGLQQEMGGASLEDAFLALIGVVGAGPSTAG